MSIYKAIKKDHDVQRDLCEKLMATEDKGKAERKKIYEELKKELKAHEVAEERFFYKPLIETDKMIEDARHGMAEHHEMDEVMEKMDDTEIDTETWFKLAKDLCDKIEHHLKDEEEDFFDDAKDIYSKEKANQLEQDYQKSMDEYRKEFN